MVVADQSCLRACGDRVGLATAERGENYGAHARGEVGACARITPRATWLATVAASLVNTASHGCNGATVDERVGAGDEGRVGIQKECGGRDLVVAVVYCLGLAPVVPTNHLTSPSSPAFAAKPYTLSFVFSSMAKTATQTELRPSACVR